MLVKQGVLDKVVADGLDTIRIVRNEVAHTPGELKGVDISQILQDLKKLSKRIPPPI